MAFIPTLDSSRLLRKKFINPQSLAELAVEANVWRTAQDNRYVTRAEYVAGGSGIAPTIFDAKGDLIVASANDTPLRFPVGTNGQMLVPDSNLTAGIKWADRPALYTNLVLNPSVETNTTNISAIGSGTTIARVTTDFYVGTASVRAVGDGTVAGQGVVFATASNLAAGVYSVAAWVKAPAGTAMQLAAFTSLGSFQTMTFTGTGSWQRVVFSGAVVATGTFVADIRVITAAATAVTIYADAALMVAGTEVPDYFDGDTAGCYWTGTAHASTSVRAALSATDGVGRQSLPTLTRNLVTNPSFELGTTGWTSVAGTTLNRGSDGGAVGVGYLNVTVSGTNANSGAEMSTRVRVTPATTYTLSAYVAAQVTAAHTMSALFYDEAGAQVGSAITTAFTPGPGRYVRPTITTVAPSGAATVAIRITRDVAAVVALVIDAVQIEVGRRATAYVDGDQKGCYWTGTPHASESARMVRGDDGIAKLDLPELVRNMVHNPSFENAITGYSAGPNSTFVRSTAASFVGAASGLLTRPDATTGNAFASFPVLIAAGTYTFSYYARTATGTPSVRAIVYPDAIGNPALVVSSAVALTGSFARYQATFTTPTARTVILLVEFTTNVSGEAAYLDAWQLEAGGQATPYVDGDQAGCYWTGPSHLSESVRYGTNRELAMLDRDLSGTGSPEGSIAAPVGTRYTDTAATVGARSWEKATGTGNTGWVAMGADTGDRLVASGITNLGDATVTVRRVGSQVTVTLIQPTAGTATGTVSLTTLALGFRPTRTGSIVAAPVVNQAGAIVTGAALAVTDAGVVTLTGATNATRHYAQVTYTTANAYPTTLPGTAA